MQSLTSKNKILFMLAATGVLSVMSSTIEAQNEQSGNPGNSGNRISRDSDVSRTNKNTGSQNADTYRFSKRHKMPPTQSPHRPSPGANAQFGDPLPGLDNKSLAAFLEGREEFEAQETAEGGIGPIFNNTSCVACHSAGATGGASDEKVTRFGRLEDGVFDPLESLGGSLLQANAIDPAVQEVVPPQANVIAQRLSTPTFGAGLIEAIPDETILGNQRRRKPIGIAGRAAQVIDPVSGETRIGRFGWKAQHASVLGIAADAYVNEMGITSRIFPTENAPNGRTDLLEQYDLVPDVEDPIDPETGKSDIDHSADYMRFLAAPPVVRLSRSALAGKRLFEKVQCAACHTPVMFTGANEVSALANQRVALYSDLLLHDMGSLNDRIAQSGAGSNEMRTAPLWGLRVRTSFLHDGRARTASEAIQMHDGEAAQSREQFLSLTTEEQQQIIDFLNSI